VAALTNIGYEVFGFHIGRHGLDFAFTAIGLAWLTAAFGRGHSPDTAVLSGLAMATLHLGIWVLYPLLIPDVSSRFSCSEHVALLRILKRRKNISTLWAGIFMPVSILS